MVRHSRLLLLFTMCLKFVVVAWNAMRISRPSAFVHWECVWEYRTRRKPRLCIVSSARKVPFEGAQRHASVFCYNTVYGFQGARLYWLAGEMTEYRERGRKKAKGRNMSVWGPRRGDHWTICSGASKAAFNAPALKWRGKKNWICIRICVLSRKP